MKKVLIAPRKYIQGRGVLGELGTYLKLLGQEAARALGPVRPWIGRRDDRTERCRSGTRSWSPWISRAKLRRPSGPGLARSLENPGPTCRWASAAAKCWMWPKPWPST